MTEKSKKDKIAIAGFGLEGQAVFEYLRGQNPDLKIHIFDENSGDLGVQPPSHVVFHKGLDVPADFDIVYKTPGIPTSKLKLKNPNTKISSLTNLFFEKAKGTIIGVTGTKGKGTITTLINHILLENDLDSTVLGNIGVTGLKMLKDDSKNKFYIYEMSSFQCEHLNKSPHIAILNNIYLDHLNHHKNFDEYKKAKLNITKFQSKNDYFINASDFDIETKAKQIKITEPFVLDRVASARDDGFCEAKSVIDNELCSLSSLRGTKQSSNTDFKKFETKLLGEHNQRNCQVAFGVVKILGIPENKIREAIKTYKPLPLRLEKVAEKNGVIFYDDSFATIPEATQASIGALSDVNTIILGGSDKGSSYENFAKELEKTSIKNFIIFPNNGKEMVKYIKDDLEKKIFEVDNMQDAIKTIYKNCQGICLMSSAAASFELFKDYKDKSEQYRYWIEKLS